MAITNPQMIRLTENTLDQLWPLWREGWPLTREQIEQALTPTHSPDNNETGA